MIDTSDPVVAERLARARDRSVLICTPIARNPVWEYTASFGATILLLQEHGIKVEFQFVVGNSLIHKARNELCAQFLASDFTDMLFIDDDMRWNPQSVLRLLGSDKPLTGGVGRQRIQKPNSDFRVWCWRPVFGPNGELTQDEMGAVEVRGFGAAFMMINRSVFLDLAEAFPDLKRDAPKDWKPEVAANYYEFFSAGWEECPELSEDYVFCERYRKVGGRIWVDPTITLGHIGSFNYSGSLAESILQEPQCNSSP